MVTKTIAIITIMQYPESDTPNRTPSRTCCEGFHVIHSTTFNQNIKKR
jgi:hypothetical protein